MSSYAGELFRNRRQEQIVNAGVSGQRFSWRSDEDDLFDISGSIVQPDKPQDEKLKIHYNSGG